MGSVSIWHWLVVGFLAMILFGRGRLSDVMTDFAKGLKAFKKGMEDEPTQPESKDSLPKQ
jgi:sec-independent protein translocase protein TatA